MNQEIKITDTINEIISDNGSIFIKGKIDENFIELLKEQNNEEEIDKIISNLTNELNELNSNKLKKIILSFIRASFMLGVELAFFFCIPKLPTFMQHAIITYIMEIFAGITGTISILSYLSDPITNSFKAKKIEKKIEIAKELKEKHHSKIVELEQVQTINISKDEIMHETIKLEDANVINIQFMQDINNKYENEKGMSLFRKKGKKRGKYEL